VAYNQAMTNLLTNSKQFFLGIDVEVVARKDSLLSGINVNSSPMFFRAQVGNQLVHRPIERNDIFSIHIS
jgi:hypothetical protein